MVFTLALCILFSKYHMVIAEDLQLSGESYVLMDEISGRIILEKDPHKKMPMASTTKIMTTLVAIENADLNDKVVIDEQSINIEGSSIYLEKGEVMSLEDLLYGLMLRSGNDAAVAISRHVGKTEERFVDIMNAKAKSINALNTHFENPHGLSHENHYSTAYDLALITKEAFKHKEFMDISKTKSYHANREKNNYFVNKNKILWEYEGGDGGKTGYTMNAGRCLVSTSNRNGFRLIAVSLNAPNWFNDNYKLLDYGFENFKQYLIYDKGQFIRKAEVLHGKTDVELVMEDYLIYPLTEKEREKIKVSIVLDKKLEAPIKRGQRLGTLETYLDGKLIKEEKLIAKKDVYRENIVNRLFKKVNMGFN